MTEALDDWLLSNAEFSASKLLPESESVLDAEIATEAERVFKAAAISIITETAPEYSLAGTYEVPEPSSSIDCLFNDLLTLSNVSPEIRSKTNMDTGNVVGYIEVWDEKLEGAGDAKTSLSLHRTVDTKAATSFMGSSNNFPFVPGGLEEQLENVLRLANDYTNGDEEKFLFFEAIPPMELLTSAPGVSGGLSYESVITPDVSKGSGREEEKLSKTAYANGIDFNTASIFDLIDLVSEGMNVPDFEQEKPEVKQSASSEEIILKRKPSEDEKVLNTVVASEVITQAVKLPAESVSRESEQQNEYSHARVLDTLKKVPEFEEIRNRMAKKYDFELDPFQQQAVVRMEQGDSVFVAAHTSAGKTVVAEYALALCQIHKTRAIYTSPIKALSNQKFRDFKLMFDDVGLITGDIQLHPEAFALVMTTEVLRSMLYNGSEIVRELEWVIFDEVHYINDIERGHVWEEVLIMLPSHVKIVMLSATVPNCVEFADWVGRIKKRRIYVITTSKRPVPLEHFLYTGQDAKTKNDLFKIVDNEGNFVSKGYTLANEAKSKLHKPTAGAKVFRPSGKTDKNIYINLIKHLSDRNLLPMVIFVFSRRRCDENAFLLQSVDLTTAKEKSYIHRFFAKCVARLKGSDKELPQVLHMEELCKRGFAVHHSGILPILKEIVELLFQKGYVKILFATETFAMGVNMPARTVVFDSMRKHDGRELRNLNPGEYIQMAGRAGRRGLDSTGTVIILCKGPQVPEPTELTIMMLGKPTKLESRFRITYSMLLNLLRVEHLRIEDMLQHSFLESASLRQVLARQSERKKVAAEIAAYPVISCSTCCPSSDEHRSISEYHARVREFVRFRGELWHEMLRSANFEKMFVAGRLVIVALPQLNRNSSLALVLKLNSEGSRRTLQLLISVEDDFTVEKEEKIVTEEFNKLPSREREWRIESSLVETVAFTGFERLALPRKGGKRSTYRILDNIPFSSLIAVCQKVLRIDVATVYNDLRIRAMPRFRQQSPDSSLSKVVIEMDTLASKWAYSVEGADVALPGREIQITSAEVFAKIMRLNELRNYLIVEGAFPCRHCLLFRQHLRMVRDLVHLQEKYDDLSFSLSSGSLLLSSEYAEHLQVLRKLNYIDETNLVALKGKVACEIHHQELVITELLLDNKLQSRSTAEIAAMLSSTTCQYKMGDRSKESESEKPVLKLLKEDVLEVADKIARVQRECGVKAVDPSEELNFDLMEVVYEWANATPFAEIMKLTDAQEGLIVRCIQRLDEVCRDVRNAARLVGDPALFEKMEETSAAIRRDIVFAASLYTVVE